MGLLNKLNPFTAIAEPILNIIDKVIPDKAAAAKAKALFNTGLMQGTFAVAIKQLEVNAIESASDRWWKAAWRPFFGFSCGLGFFWQYFLRPVFGSIVMLVMDEPVELPSIDIAGMMPVALGMLGLGYLRTDEKKNGVHKT